MRASGVVTTATGFRPGDHVCWLHDGDDARLARPIAAFLDEGLRRNEHVVFVAPDPHLRAKTLLGGLDDLVTSGRVTLVDLADAYDVSSPPEAMVDGFVAMAEAAVAAGKSGLRVAADVTRPAVEGGEDYLRYEQLVDRAMRHRPMTGLCIIDRSALDDPGLLGCLHLASNDAGVPFSLLAADVRSGDDLVLIGEVDALHASRLAAGARASACGPVLRIDALRATFLDHRALMALDALDVERVELRTGFGGARRLAGLVPFQRLSVEVT